MKQILYKDARRMMRCGDLIAFGGQGVVSKIIKTATNNPISHVGTILQTSIPTLHGILVNQVIESVVRRKAVQGLS